MRRLALIPAAVLLALLLPAPPAWADWVWPLRGRVITPYRNGDDPYAAGQHRGIDIAGDVGAPVVAATAGDVRFAGVAGSSGITVSIRTADGHYDTSYLHLSAVAVHKGDRVRAGERVGNVGTTGVRSAVQPHLHFGVRDAGTRHGYHDPLAFLPPLADAPDAPREAPAPVPAPARPAPEPVRAPSAHEAPDGHAAPDARRAPARRRVPAGRRVPARRRVPVKRRVPAARRVPAGDPSPLPSGAPALRSAPAHRSSPSDGRVRIPGVAPHAAPGRDAGRHPRPHQHGAPHGRRLGDPHVPRHTHASPSDSSPGRTAAGGGPDLGLVVACVGVLIAAAVLGLSEDGRRATRTGRDRLQGLVSPLLGRR